MVQDIGSGLKCFLIVLTTGMLAACQPKNNKNMSSEVLALRLKPGADLKEELEKLATEKNIEAGWMVSCAGSLTDYTIRFANQPEGQTGSGHFEIISLSGTISKNGSHLHIGISDSTGKTIGGHLLRGCKVYTTAEIVIGYSDRFVFTREKDGTTPWEELQIKEKGNGQ